MKLKNMIGRCRWDGRRRALVLLLAAATGASALVGCASGDANNRADAEATNAGARQTGQASVDDARPIEADSATLLVQGLSCPKCANNVDLALAKVRGVESASIDMGTGEVRVRFRDGQSHPSRADLAAAIDRTGFTLTEIRVP